MNWISRGFLVLLLGILGFGLYQLRTPDSSGSKRKFKRTLNSQNVSRKTDTGPPVRELNPPLRKLAGEIGFESDTVQRNVLNREWSRVEGEPVSLDEYEGRWILLNFWASWCLPCREEMPSLQRLRKKFDPKTLRILTVNVMEPRDEIQEFTEEENLSLPVLLDPDGSLSDAFGVRGLPVTWVIPPGGDPLMRLQGSHEWDRSRVVRLLRQLTEQD